MKTDVLNFKANNKTEYNKLFGEAEAKADEKIKRAYIKRKYEAGKKFIKQITNKFHKNGDGQHFLLEIEKADLNMIDVYSIQQKRTSSPFLFVNITSTIYLHNF